MTQNIQYTFHLILQSKYKIIVNIIIYLLIYLAITNAQVAFCMTEDNTLPTIVEDKSGPETSAIITETDIRQVLTDTIEKQREIIEQQKEKINFLEQNTREYMLLSDTYKDRNDKLVDRLLEADTKIKSLKQTVSKLTQEKKEIKDTLDFHKKYLGI